MRPQWPGLSSLKPYFRWLTANVTVFGFISALADPTAMINPPTVLESYERANISLQIGYCQGGLGGRCGHTHQERYRHRAEQ